MIWKMPPLTDLRFMIMLIWLFRAAFICSFPVHRNSLMASGQNIFEPISSDSLPHNINSRDDHPVHKLGIDSTGPISTNKFYAGFFLGHQTTATFTQPYSLSWSRGNGNTSNYGMAISHTDTGMCADGPPNSRIPGNPISYYINPLGIESMILSASELGPSSVLGVENPTPFSAHIVLQSSAGSNQKITFPAVQGMGFVTGIYSNLEPELQSSTTFKDAIPVESPRDGVFKYRVTLADGESWLVYAAPDDGANPNLGLKSNISLRGPSGFSGIIQVARNPAGSSGEKLYDNSAGTYPVGASIHGSVSKDAGTYSLKWTKAGKDVDSTPLMMFALPHHVESFDAPTKERKTDLQLHTTTKGKATAVTGEHWTMVESGLPTTMGFSPWSPSKGDATELSHTAKQKILDAASDELGQDIDAQTNLDSMYFSGKVLSKYAVLVYTVSKLGSEPSLAAAALDSLKQSFARFTSNKQKSPLVYDNVWKGLVSSAGYGGNPGADFGNTYYNDHHFHYGYFMHAAAIIGYLDENWLSENKDWVNTLVRDAGNPVDNDPSFPFSRAFDWYNGHSWAKGLLESKDGKDQESTSEDAMFAYALKMWGKISGDASMEARGNLMLGILRRSFRNYFLLKNDNENQPSNFIANKVSGILFENKVAHSTYFGNKLEYIQGIHMLPLLPCSPYIRSKEFVAEEWKALFAENATEPADQVQGGWRGILYANFAISDPEASWKYFAQPNFDDSYIDDGATRTWYLAFAAGLGGAPS